MVVFVDDTLHASTCEDVTTQRPSMIEIDEGPCVQSILVKYSTYIGTRNYADVPSMTEYVHRDTTSTFPKQPEYVSAYPYAEIVG